MSGKLYGVSVGPGDPELMTLKAKRIIEQCGVIAAPRTHGEKMMALSIAEKSADLSGKRIIPIDFPMSGDRKILYANYDRAAETLCNELGTNDVAMLSIGDVSVYSTFHYIAERVAEKGFKVEVCAGVTSFCAAAAAAGRSLVKDKEKLLIMPYDGGDSLADLDVADRFVIMKSGKNAEKLIGLLKRDGLDSETCAVQNCGLTDEAVYYDLDDIDEKCGYFTVFLR